MNVSSMIRKFRHFADENSPVILTGMAVSGSFLASYLTYKGTMKSAGQILKTVIETEATENTEKKFSTAEIVSLTWKNYIPAAAALGGTTACMVLATKIGLDRTAAATAALVVTERTYDQYKDKIKETLGENKHVKIVDAVATDQVSSVPNNSTIILGDDEQWCFDVWSGRYFKSKREIIDRAVNEFNRDLLTDDYASLSEFYDRLNLDHIQESDRIGWRNDHLLELKYTAVLKDNKPCLAFTFDPVPTARFQDTHG